MARSSVETNVLSMLSDDEPPTNAVEDDERQEPAYVLAANQSIPVPRKFGDRWKQKIDDAMKAYEPEHTKWDALFNMFRLTGIEIGLDADMEYEHHMESDADENVIRQVLQTIIRSTYMKNPSVEFTVNNKKDEELKKVLTKAVEVLISKSSAPGFNLKPKARRWLLHALLTNFGVMKIDYQELQGSIDQARENLKKIEDKLSDRKLKTSAIDQAYAELELLYEEMPLLSPQGIKMLNVLPHRLVIDPDCDFTDLDSAMWCAEIVDLDNDYVDKKYFIDNESGEKVYRSNTDVVAKTTEEKSNEDDVKAKVIDTVIGETSDERREVIKENTTRCYYIWDKLTRRVYLYSSNDWSQPLWVWDDPLGLTRFFPFFIFGITMPIDGVVQAGEASQMVGPNKVINMINRKAYALRRSIFGAIWYNSKAVDKDEVAKFISHMKNPDEVKAFGVKIDEEMDIEKVLHAFAPPASKYEDFFNTAPSRQVIDRVAAQSEMSRGGQFKTNTTNDQVQFYEQQEQMRSGVITDALEEALEDMILATCELLVSKYDRDAMSAIVGDELAAAFTPMSVQQFNHTVHINLAAGSTEKPTSQYKRKEAMDIAQALGQVGQGAPGTTMRLLLKLFSNAFSEFNLTQDDWSALDQEMQANMQKGVSTDAPQTERTQ